MSVTVRLMTAKDYEAAARCFAEFKMCTQSRGPTSL